MPLTTRLQVCRLVRKMLPRERFGHQEMLLWPDDVQRRNEGAWYSHENRRAACYAATAVPP